MRKLMHTSKISNRAEVQGRTGIKVKKRSMKSVDITVVKNRDARRDKTFAATRGFAGKMLLSFRSEYKNNSGNQCVSGGQDSSTV